MEYFPSAVVTAPNRPVVSPARVTCAFATGSPVSPLVTLPVIVTEGRDCENAMPPIARTITLHNQCTFLLLATGHLRIHRCPFSRFHLHSFRCSGGLLIPRKLLAGHNVHGIQPILTRRQSIEPEGGIGSRLAQAHGI